MALEVTDASFASDIIESGKPAMVDFWAVGRACYRISRKSSYW